MDVSVANQVKMSTVPVWNEGLDCRQGEAVGLAGAVWERLNRSPSHRSVHCIDEAPVFVLSRRPGCRTPNPSSPAFPQLRCAQQDLASMRPATLPNPGARYRKRDFQSLLPSARVAVQRQGAPLDHNFHSSPSY